MTPKIPDSYCDIRPLLWCFELEAAGREHFPILAYTEKGEPVFVYTRDAFAPLFEDGYIVPAPESHYPVIAYHAIDSRPFFSREALPL